MTLSLPDALCFRFDLQNLSFLCRLSPGENGDQSYAADGLLWSKFCVKMYFEENSLKHLPRDNERSVVNGWVLGCKGEASPNKDAFFFFTWKSSMLLLETSLLEILRFHHLLIACIKALVWFIHFFDAIITWFLISSLSDCSAVERFTWRCLQEAFSGPNHDQSLSRHSLKLTGNFFSCNSFRPIGGVVKKEAQTQIYSSALFTNH